MKEFHIFCNVLFVFFFLYSCDSQSQKVNPVGSTSNIVSPKVKKNHLKKMNLKGDVESVRDTVYKVVDNFGKIKKGEIDLNSHENVSIVFNKFGNMIEKKSDFDVVNIFLRRYDEDDSNDGDFGEYLSKKIYIYNEKGDEIEQNWYYEGNLSSKQINKYNDKGMISESSIYKSDGTFVKKETYKYDNLGNRIEMKWYFQNGNLFLTYTYKYDTSGNKIEWYSDGEKQTYKYDEEGNNVEIFHTHSGKEPFATTFEYEFDSLNNWIKRIEYKNRIPQFIVVRTIKYFKP